MTNAVPMPGAMMNHFVIANWEDPDAQNVIGSQAHRATSQVKILKYYPGAEITGVVKLDDDSMNMDGVRLLFEEMRLATKMEMKITIPTSFQSVLPM